MSFAIASPQSAPVAFLGLGTMGAPMTLNLAKNGFNVTGWNRTPHRPQLANLRDKGIPLVATLAEAVRNADFIFTCVGDIPDVEEILLGSDGVIHFAKPGARIVDFSTIGALAARRLAQ